MKPPMPIMFLPMARASNGGDESLATDLAYLGCVGGPRVVDEPAVKPWRTVPHEGR